MSLKSAAKSGLLAAVSALTGRHAVLLPREAESEDALLDVRAPYRVETQHLSLKIDETIHGELRVTLLGYDGHFPRRPLWNSSAPYRGASCLGIDLTTGEVRLEDTVLDRLPLPLPGRRFCFDLELETAQGCKRRRTGHYLASDNGSYYEGGNYVDYEQESRGEIEKVLELVEIHGAEGPLLEIGCATGVVLEALVERGVEGFGLDLSSWAVERARERLGPSRVFECDPESATLPDELGSRGPFRTLLLWAVLEHFRDPFATLERLGAHAALGAKLFINTTNAESLNRLLFDSEWEGYFDTSHHGVDAVSVTSLRRELPGLGWRIEELTTHLSWDSNPDPTHETLRQWWASDARFRRLLTERDRGDLVTCVAVKE